MNADSRKSTATASEFPAACVSLGLLARFAVGLSRLLGRQFRQFRTLGQVGRRRRLAEVFAQPNIKRFNLRPVIIDFFRGSPRARPGNCLGYLLAKAWYSATAWESEPRICFFAISFGHTGERLLDFRHVHHRFLNKARLDALIVG